AGAKEVPFNMFVIASPLFGAVRQHSQCGPAGLSTMRRMVRICPCETIMRARSTDPDAEARMDFPEDSMDSRDPIYDEAARLVVEVGNRLAEQNPDADLWDIA